MFEISYETLLVGFSFYSTKSIQEIDVLNLQAYIMIIFQNSLREFANDGTKSTRSSKHIFIFIRTTADAGCTEAFRAVSFINITAVNFQFRCYNVERRCRICFRCNCAANKFYVWCTATIK